eukprot:CAMPEP_0202957516 /NCGR_PEP_ID=MMETSP1396-20130829/1887_1 /ASSEMBLY_ACC=CAM_ASM_000872 /TAXON_ID= /ORGANISM="Pseudokeronopsis sp., Strain Brazil" /LENGTH=76 /DNA_ID=CAMNT_0049675023 /DNA_START=380 /DNA_END=610 /DNA_ORIENTATION=+
MEAIREQYAYSKEDEQALEQLEDAQKMALELMVFDLILIAMLVLSFVLAFITMGHVEKKKGTIGKGVGYRRVALEN